MRAVEVEDADRASLRPDDAAGRIAAEYVYLYPPGIPLLVPGEQISSEALAQIRRWRQAGMEIAGVYSGDSGQEEFLLQAVKESGSAPGDGQEE